MSVSAIWPARVFTSVALVWAGALPAATLGASETGASARGFATLVYAIGHVLCHQRPERSFTSIGQPWPVCARCTGIYVGAALGVLIAQALRRHRVPDASVVRLWLAAALLPTVLTVLYEVSTGQMPAHAVRAGAGGLVGLVASVLIVVFLREWHHAGAATSNQRA